MLSIKYKRYQKSITLIILLVSIYSLYPLEGVCKVGIAHIFTSKTHKKFSGEFSKKEDITHFLNKEGIDKQDALLVEDKLQHLSNLFKDRRKIAVEIFLAVNKKHLISMKINVDPINSIMLQKQGNDFISTFHVNKSIRQENIKISHELKKSVYEISSYEAPKHVVNQLLNLYSPYVNLKKLKESGKIEFLVKMFYEGDRIVEFGEVIFTKFISSSKNNVVLYKHQFRDGSMEFVNVTKNSLLDMQISHLDFSIPVPSNSRISSGFGKRINPVTGILKPHNGVDFAVSTGTPIKAANSGNISYIGNRGGYGKYMKIAHDNGYETAYAHLSRFNSKLKVGSKVLRGSLIAYSGNSGRTTGPHLHYEIIHHGKHIDPMKIHSHADSHMTYTQNFDRRELNLLRDNLNKMKRMFAMAPTIRRLS